MRIEITQADMERNQSNPFESFYRSNSQELRSYMEKLSQEMLDELRGDYRPGYPTNNPWRIRTVADQREGGGYFARNTAAHVPSHWRKVPNFTVLSYAPNALLYEASHGNFQRLLQKFEAGQ